MHEPYFRGAVSSVCWWCTGEPAVLADDASLLVDDIEGARGERSLTVEARETAHVVDAVAVHLVEHEVARRHRVTTAVTPTHAVPAADDTPRPDHCNATVSA